MRKLIDAEAPKAQYPEHRSLAEKLDAAPAANLCTGCVNENDLSCCCHGGRGYEPKTEKRTDWASWMNDRFMQTEEGVYQ